jgi:secreted trypsin-like serine protease
MAKTYRPLKGAGGSGGKAISARESKRYSRKEKVGMTKIKLVLTVVAMLAVTMLAGAAPPAALAIVGGTAVPDGKYPFVAALLDERRTGNAFDQQFCGGSLIDSDSVLTAAHCVDGIFLSNLSVVVGRTQLSTNQGQLREAVRMYIPDGYNFNQASKNDVAVLSLKSPVTGIDPVEIASVDDNWHEQAGKSQTIAGWGSMSGGASPDRMQEVKVPVVSDADAAKLSSSFIPELMISAGEKGKDTCQGDSGGPLFATWKRLGPGTGRYSQHGITAFGKGCGVDPGTYTEVNAPSIREFITTSMKK